MTLLRLFVNLTLFVPLSIFGKGVRGMGY